MRQSQGQGSEVYRKFCIAETEDRERTEQAKWCRVRKRWCWRSVSSKVAHSRAAGFLQAGGVFSLSAWLHAVSESSDIQPHESCVSFLWCRSRKCSLLTQLAFICWRKVSHRFTFDWLSSILTYFIVCTDVMSKCCSASTWCPKLTVK